MKTLFTAPSMGRSERALQELERLASLYDHFLSMAISVFRRSLGPASREDLNKLEKSLGERLSNPMPWIELASHKMDKFELFFLHHNNHVSIDRVETYSVDMKRFLLPVIHQIIPKDLKDGMAVVMQKHRSVVYKFLADAVRGAFFETHKHLGGVGSKYAKQLLLEHEVASRLPKPAELEFYSLTPLDNSDPTHFSVRWKVTGRLPGRERLEGFKDLDFSSRAAPPRPS